MISRQISTGTIIRISGSEKRINETAKIKFFKKLSIKVPPFLSPVRRKQGGRRVSVSGFSIKAADNRQQFITNSIHCLFVAVSVKADNVLRYLQCGRIRKTNIDLRRGVGFCFCIFRTGFRKYRFFRYFRSGFLFGGESAFFCPAYESVETGAPRLLSVASFLAAIYAAF